MQLQLLTRRLSNAILIPRQTTTDPHPCHCLQDIKAAQALSNTHVTPGKALLSGTLPPLFAGH